LSLNEPTIGIERLKAAAAAKDEAQAAVGARQDRDHAGRLSHAAAISLN